MAVLAEDACLVTFNVTELEKEVADLTEIPLYGCPPELVHLGFKSGSRKVAREAGVPVLPGAEDLFSVEDVYAALRALKDAGATSAVIKLNEGFSGQGNAVVELCTPCARRCRRSPTAFCASEESWESFARKIEDERRRSSNSSPAVGTRHLTQRADADRPRRFVRGRFDARSDPRRSRRPGLPRLQVPGVGRVPAADPRARGARGQGARRRRA